MISESDPHKNDFFATFGRLPILFEVQVNLIPLIGKADSFTKEELQEFKQNVFSSSFPRIFQKGQKIFFLSNSPQICNQLASEKILFHNFTTCRNQVEGTNDFLNTFKQNHRNYKLLYQLWLQKDISQYIQIFYLRMLLERKNLHRHPLL